MSELFERPRCSEFPEFLRPVERVVLRLVAEGVGDVESGVASGADPR